MKKSLSLSFLVLPISYFITINLATPATADKIQITTRVEPALEPHFTGQLTLNIPPEMSNLENKPVSHIADIKKFEATVKYAKENNLSQRYFGEIIQKISEQFLGTAYKAGLLDESTKENLVVNLTQFDCVLFVETVLAIARGVAVQDYSSQTFSINVKEQRYRNGELNGYCSRLHYFSEWISDNEKRGNVTNITANLGGVYMNKTLNFMSKNRQSYPKFANNEAEYQCVVNMENSLKNLSFNYIPTNEIHKVYNQLQPGDIIAIATNIEGLDVTHTGLIYRTVNDVGLIHASPSGSVKVSRDLETFVSQVEDSIGIVVARPKDPRYGISGQ